MRTILTLKCIFVFNWINLVHVILMIEMRRHVYLHDKSCAYYYNNYEQKFPSRTRQRRRRESRSQYAVHTLLKFKFVDALFEFTSPI